VPFLGLSVDPMRNAAPGGEADVSADGAAARTLVVHAREEVVIARAARALLGAAA
jgi:acetate kinase